MTVLRSLGRGEDGRRGAVVTFLVVLLCAKTFVVLIMAGVG